MNGLEEIMQNVTKRDEETESMKVRLRDMRYRMTYFPNESNRKKQKAQEKQSIQK